MAVASSAVSRDAAVAADTKFTIADQAPVIGEQICDRFRVLVPRDGDLMPDRGVQPRSDSALFYRFGA